MNKLPESLHHKTLVLGPAREEFKLTDLVRKQYVVVCEDSNHEAEPCYFDNSAAAEAFAAANGELEVVVNEIFDKPKRAFFDLWNQFKKEIKAQGVFLTRVGNEYAVTDRQPTRAEVLRNKGYGRRRNTTDWWERDYSPTADTWNKHDWIDHQATYPEKYGLRDEE